MDIVFLQHAEHVDGGDVEELDVGFGEEDADFEGGGVGGHGRLYGDCRGVEVMDWQGKRLGRQCLLLEDWGLG